MTQNLKIKIKEVVEEKRYLTEEEDLIYDLWRSTGKSNSKKIEKFWEETAFDYKNYEDGNKATFRRERIRDATPEEIRAYYMVELSKVGWIYQPIVGWGYDVCLMDKMYNILKGKEIILEIEESE